MPLKSGNSDKTVGKNIEKLIKEGYARKTAIAIAMDKAGIDRKLNDGENDKRKGSKV